MSYLYYSHVSEEIRRIAEEKFGWLSFEQELECGEPLNFEDFDVYIGYLCKGQSVPFVGLCFNRWGNTRGDIYMRTDDDIVTAVEGVDNFYEYMEKYGFIRLVK